MAGEVGAETMTRKKKKKGRPSLLELQKRSLKQQQQQQQQQQLQQQNPNSRNPNSLNSGRRSNRLNPNSDGASPAGDWIGRDGGGGDDDDDDERQQKKHKLLLGLNSSRNHQHYPTSSAPNSVSNGSDSNADGEDPEASLKRRRISAIPPGSDQTGEKVSKATDTLHGSPVESGPTTPLPDKKLLVFILDRLQKKDTYGVFSEPVDPEELPDYHEIISHPMDFGTVRTKLDGGAYTTLEQFEKDVFLICSNAMQYNAPDTIYFRQARSMHELAKKDFEDLRQDSDDSEPQPKVVRRGRPPGKSLKKSLEPSSFDRVGSEFSSDATLATGGDNATGSNTYNLRKGNSSNKLKPADTLVRASYGSHNNETYACWLSEWENEFPASVVRAVMKYGKKHFAVDENRRHTYNPHVTSGHEQPLFATLDRELKQLIPVGLSSEHGYATSLARFAAGLGPAVWKIASKKIESVLPAGVKFGPGWVGENRATEQPQDLFSGKQKCSINSLFDNHSNRLLSPSNTQIDNNPSGSLLSSVNSGSNTVLASRGEDVETARRLNSQSELTSQHKRVDDVKPVSPYYFQQRPSMHSGMNGLSGGFGVGQVGMVTPTRNSKPDNTSVPSQMLGMVSDSSPTIYQTPGDDCFLSEAKLSDSSGRVHSGNMIGVGSESASHTAVNVGLQGKMAWQGLSTYNKQEFHPFPPDLNVRFLAPGSPSSSLRIGSPQQPDLALQL